MPWKESRIVDQRLQFLSSYQKEEMSVSDLCREFVVSQPTGYRWINRYKEVGPEGLLDLSSRPHSCSHATQERTENAILALQSKYPSWLCSSRRLSAAPVLYLGLPSRKTIPAPRLRLFCTFVEVLGSWVRR